MWVMPRPMYDCICICAMNKGECDVVVEIDYRQSDNVSSMSRGGAALSPSRRLGEQGLDYLDEPTTHVAAPLSDQYRAAERGGVSDDDHNPNSCRAEVLQKQTTIVGVLCPSTPEAPMDVVYRARVVAMASLDGAREVDVGALRVIHGAAQQSSEVQEWLQRRNKH